MNEKTDINSDVLMPNGKGHRFVFYGDCCSGIPGEPFEENFKQVNAVLQHISKRPDFILFLGDHVMGMRATEEELRAQWRHWHDTEMAWLTDWDVPIYHTTSNHDTYDEMSEHVWRDVFPAIPSNGPPEQEGLSYWLRKDDLLMVFVNTHFSGLGGTGHVECEWLDSVLGAEVDATYKIVCGHQPVFAVNGYGSEDDWCIDKDEGAVFWRVLVKHGVLAYLCSHVIAFDQQEQDGVMQICSGGAGTNYGPGGFMGDGEYHHFVQAALDDDGFRFQTVDTDGKIREVGHVKYSL